MAVNLVEAYKNRINLAESIHMKSHNGAKMSAQKKLMIASVLNNTSKFLNERFEGASATNRSDIGNYKRFCLNVSNVALPNLILPELVLVSPMASLTGYITYLHYSAGTTKGGVTRGELFNGVYRMGDMTEERQQYTSDVISESHDVTSTDVTNLKISLNWVPIADVEHTQIKIGNFTYAIVEKGHEVKDASVSIDKDTGFVTFATGDTKFIAGAKVLALYKYNNVVVPQTSFPTSLPTLTAKMDYVQLTAHARRIAVYYSQIAAFQGKNDYGFDMGQQLAAQAQGELAYEIDTEGVMMLYNGAEESKYLSFAKYTDDKAISRSQYYEEFSEIINRAKAIIYKRTKKFTPNYMVCGTNVLTILPYLKGWTAAPASMVNGPYFAGTVDSMKVFVSPAIGDDEFFFGVNGSDLQTSAAVYAPYMAIVPTQLLGFADGTMSQGFSTMYDMKLLSCYKRSGDNEDNYVREDTIDTGDGNVYSWLLIRGKLTGDATYLNVKKTDA